ncbi:MAG: NAD(P)/FAD-dependent oxidoreductase [Deltaproteobacteria bacterium]|nr:NAD(P)/FAD-dependent oxidoreductase [Deltaproteobacteria bacterium]
MAKYVIIGNSAAGLAGVKAIRSKDPCGEVTIISDEKHFPYSRVLLTHYIAGHIKIEDFFLEDRDLFIRLKVNQLLGTRAIAIHPLHRTVELETGQAITYETLLIATGGLPAFPINLPAKIKGITGLRTIEDAINIRQQAMAGAKVVIWGGGLVGVKLACALHEAGNSPEMIVSSPHLLSQVADDEGGRLVQQHMERHGLRIRCSADVVRVVQDSAGGLKSTILNNGEEIPCHLLVVCKGVRPNTSLVDKLLSGSGGIPVDSRMRTRLPNIYAAGDVANTYDITRQESCSMPIWPHAVAQGRTAGLNMAGEKARYRGSLPRNALEILGLPFISMGIVQAPAQEEWEVSIHRQGNNYQKLVYFQGRLVGAMLTDRVEPAGRLQASIRSAAGDWFDQYSV